MSVNRISRFFETGGVKIHFREVGEGRPVVLLHGAFVDSESNWGSLLDSPATPYRFVAPDLRGHGRSSALRRPEQYGAELFRDVLRLMDHLGLERADVVGYSMGGKLALKLAADHADRVRSVLVGGKGWKPDEAASDNSAFADALERTNSVADMMDPDRTFPAPVRAAMDRHDPRAAAAMARGDWWETEVTRESLLRLAPRLAVLVGERDPEAAGAKRLADLVPGATLTTLAGHDHLSIISAPEFREAILDFLRRNVDPRPKRLF